MAGKQTHCSLAGVRGGGEGVFFHPNPGGLNLAGDYKG